jgi:hypothetical protein
MPDEGRNHFAWGNRHAGVKYHDRKPLLASLGKPVHDREVVDEYKIIGKAHDDAQKDLESDNLLSGNADGRLPDRGH